MTGFKYSCRGCADPAATGEDVRTRRCVRCNSTDDVRRVAVLDWDLCAMCRQAHNQPAVDDAGRSSDFTTEPWRPDGTGVQPGGDVHPDSQVTDSHSVRFVKDDGRRLTTVTAYGVQNEETGRYAVEVDTEWLVCRDPQDPGGSEEWSDGIVQTLDVDSGNPEYDTPEEAEKAARELVERERPEWIDWDGKAEDQR